MLTLIQGVMKNCAKIKTENSLQVGMTKENLKTVQPWTIPGGKRKVHNGQGSCSSYLGTRLTVVVFVRSGR